jgi:hypothetical protein
MLPVTLRHQRSDAMSKWKEERGNVVRAGISFGSALAIVISWTANKSLLWAIVHGVLSWFYVVYYAIRYHF